jgi:hypothetical protein
VLLAVACGREGGCNGIASDVVLIVAAVAFVAFMLYRIIVRARRNR